MDRPKIDVSPNNVAGASATIVSNTWFSTVAGIIMRMPLDLNRIEQCLFWKAVN